MKFPKTFFFALLLLTGLQVSAQTKTAATEAFYVNVFISADKDIYVETEKSGLAEVSKKVSQLLRERPFKVDQQVIYRIFGDESLSLGYIMDVRQEMLKAGSRGVTTEKYLLNTLKMNIDGQNWFEAIDLQELKPVD